MTWRVIDTFENTAAVVNQEFVRKRHIEISMCYTVCATEMQVLEMI